MNYEAWDLLIILQMHDLLTGSPKREGPVEGPEEDSMLGLCEGSSEKLGLKL